MKATGEQRCLGTGALRATTGSLTGAVAAGAMLLSGISTSASSGTVTRALGLEDTSTGGPGSVTTGSLTGAWSTSVHWHVDWCSEWQSYWRIWLQRHVHWCSGRCLLRVPAGAAPVTDGTSTGAAPGGTDQWSCEILGFDGTLAMGNADCGDADGEHYNGKLGIHGVIGIDSDWFAAHFALLNARAMAHSSLGVGDPRRTRAMAIRGLTEPTQLPHAAQTHENHLLAVQKVQGHVRHVAYHNFFHFGLFCFAVIE
jgi:hypothetical protein